MNVDFYVFFSHSGELDDLFPTDASGLYVEMGGVTPLNMFYWREGQLLFDVVFSSGGATEANNLAVAGFPYERLPMTNFSLVRTDDLTPIPVPAAGALLPIGLAAFGFLRGSRRRRRGRAVS